jgi:hypothetical protein
MNFDFSIFSSPEETVGGVKGSDNDRGTKRDANDNILRRVVTKSSTSFKEPVAAAATTDEHTVTVDKDFGHVAAMGEEPKPDTDDMEVVDDTIKITHNVGLYL